MNKWRSWLQIFSGGLLILATFAPLPETWGKILTLVALAGMMVFFCTDSPAARRETARFGALVVALVLLALLLSINPIWVVFGLMGICWAIYLWEVDKPKHAEYLAERERLK